MWLILLFNILFEHSGNTQTVEALQSEFARQIQESDASIRSRQSARSSLMDPEQKHLRDQLVKGRYLDPSWTKVVSQFPEALQWIDEWQSAESLSSTFGRYRTDIGPFGLDSSPLATALLTVFEVDLLQWRMEVMSLFDTLLSTVRNDVDAIPGTRINREFLRTEKDNPIFLVEILEALSQIRQSVDFPPLNLAGTANRLFDRWFVLVAAYRVIPAVKQADYFRVKSLPFNQAIPFDPAVRFLDQHAKIVVLSVSSEYAFELEPFRNSPPTEVEAYLLGFLPPLLKGQGLSHGIEMSHEVLKLFEEIRSNLDEALDLIRLARAPVAGDRDVENEVLDATLVDLEAMFYLLGQKSENRRRLQFSAESQGALVALATQMPPGSDLSKAKVNQINLFRQLRTLYLEWSKLDPSVDSRHLEGETIPRVSLTDPRIVNPSWNHTKELLDLAVEQVAIVKSLESKLVPRAQDQVEAQGRLGSICYRTDVYEGYHLEGEFRISYASLSHGVQTGLRAWIDPVEAGRAEFLEQRIKEMPITALGKRISLDIDKLEKEIGLLSEANTVLGEAFQRQWAGLGVESQPYFSSYGLERILKEPMDIETDAHRELARTFLPKVLAISGKKKQIEKDIKRLEAAHHSTSEGAYCSALVGAFSELAESETDVKLRNHRMSQVRSYLGLAPISIGTLESMLDINNDGRLDAQDDEALRLSSEISRLLSR